MKRKRRNRLQRKASEEKQKKLTAKNKLLSSGMAAGQTSVDEAQTKANMQGSRTLDRSATAPEYFAREREE